MTQLLPVLDAPADRIGGRRMDTDDLVAVILGWGDCPVGTMCVADVDGSCAVDVDDLVAIELAWGCPACGESFVSEEPPTLAEAISIVLEQPIPSSTQAEIIAAMTANWN
jgi:hypothetical protein